MKLRDNKEYKNICAKLKLAGSDTRWTEYLDGMEFNGNIKDIIGVNGEVDIRALLCNNYSSFEDMLIDKLSGEIHVLKRYIRIYIDGNREEAECGYSMNDFLVERLVDLGKASKYPLQDIAYGIHKTLCMQSRYLREWRIKSTSMQIQFYDNIVCMEINGLGIKLYSDIDKCSLMREYAKGYGIRQAVVFRIQNRIWIVPGDRRKNIPIIRQVAVVHTYEDENSNNNNECMVNFNMELRGMDIEYKIDLREEHGELEWISYSEPKDEWYGLMIIDMDNKGDITGMQMLKEGRETYNW